MKIKNGSAPASIADAAKTHSANAHGAKTHGAKTHGANAHAGHDPKAHAARAATLRHTNHFSPGPANGRGVPPPPPPPESAQVEALGTDPTAALFGAKVSGNVLVNGVTIAAHGCSQAAVDEAMKIAAQVSHRPDLMKAMQKKGVTLVLIPADKKMTDLPEFADLKGKSTFDGRKWDDVRGSGGLSKNGKVYVGIPEEKLSGAGTNAYPPGYSVAMHELAHTVQNYALGPSEKKAVSLAYEARHAAGGPWTESYGASNEMEYFAQLTNCYFGRNTGIGNNGADWVKDKDPAMARILEHIYGPPPNPFSTIQNPFVA